MLRTVEAVIDAQGHVRVREPLSLLGARRVLVTILDEEPGTSMHAIALLSEVALAEDWNRPEEDMAWSPLHQAWPS